MPSLHDVFGSQVDSMRQEIRGLLKEYGNVVISEVTVAQAYGGMRGVKGMVCDTSVVEPDKGLIIRGIPIANLTDQLPEAIFFLLLTGRKPTDDELASLQKDLANRANVPEYIWRVLEAMPNDTHPMTMLDSAVLLLQPMSRFAQRYKEGMPKEEYWQPTLEDALNILAKIPVIAAGVYRLRFGKGPRIESNPDLDWGGNYARMLGLDDPDGEFADLVRLYLTLHCDHEGGNVSANTCHTVGSALSDAYYAVSAGLNGLAGPLHGLANQECLGFVLSLIEKYGGVPTKQQLTDYAWSLLNNRQVIPGYGHAVLRVTDPRFTALYEFGKKYYPDDQVFKTVDLMFQTVPDILKEHGKAKNPWPNVDAGSGAALYHYGITEFPFYTVFFSVSRTMGMLAQLVINRALGTPITRPKSVSTEWIKDFVKGKK